MTGVEMTEEQAGKIINGILGEADRYPFGNTPARPGDIAVILRNGGGCEIVSHVIPNAEAMNAEDVAMRGLFAIALYKVAQDRALMAKVFSIVAKEFDGGARRMDS